MDNDDLRRIRESHEAYWKTQRNAMRDYVRVYSTKFWVDEKEKDVPNGDIYVETTDAYADVESSTSSLYARRPANAVTQGPDEIGDERLVEGISNRFLYNQVDTIEDLVRFSYIFPYCGIKQVYVDRKNILDRLDLIVIPPWDIIVDMDARKWTMQRYTGCRYYLSLPEAKKVFGNKAWKATNRVDYLDNQTTGTGIAQFSSAATPRSAARTSNGSKSGLSTALSYVEIIEIYDFVGDERILYSPNLESRDGIVERGPIPVRNADGGPLAPIEALYMAHDPHIPLRGASAVARNYDKYREKNLYRTRMANCVRRDARLYLARAGVFSVENKAALLANVDQSIIEIKPLGDHSLSDSMIPLPSSNVSTDFERYAAQIEDDLDRGSVTAPFTKGQASSSNTTATEIAALTTYTASEIGRQKRRLDLIIERLAEIYIRTLHTLLLEDPDCKTIVTVDGKSMTLSAEALDGSFRYSASDQSSTPMSSIIRKQQIKELLPTLITLGSDPRAVLEYLVREFDMPADFLPVQPTNSPAATASGAASPSPVQPESIPVGGGQVAADVRAEAEPNMITGGR